jgi:C-terminal processing protease CtpA/Prc
MMRETFNSSWVDEESALTTLKCEMPMGMVIDEVQNLEGRKKGHFEVVEVFEDSNAEKAGIKVGDAVRACNATIQKRVNDATAFIEADTTRTKALFVADGKPFDNLIGAIQTNKSESSVTLVIERRKPGM